MNKLSLLLLLFISLNVSGQSDSVIIEGKVMNSYTGKVLDNVPLQLVVNYGSHKTYTDTEFDGTFQFKIPRSNYYYIILEDGDYIRKTISIRDTLELIYKEFSVRPREETAPHTVVDSTIIGSLARKIVKKYTLDERDISIIFEPPGKCRGFRFELADSTIIHVFVKSSMIGRERFNELKKLKVTGLVKSHPDGTEEFYGGGYPIRYSFLNPYYLDRQRE
ncbi:MAG: hypothetical protein QNK23_13665 [Crocinitomicaceae bacterium]|nr:hypothetical protein [Crocinitomicaceae bacterium]